MARLRALAFDTANMRMDHPYFQQRLLQRGVPMRQVLERNGEAIDGPRSDRYGDWRIKLARKVAGRRVQVVVAITEPNFSIVPVI